MRSSDLTTIEIFGRHHVLTRNPKPRTQHQSPNYRNTRYALCGVLEPGQTLEEWIAEIPKRNATALDRVMETLRNHRKR